MPKGRHGRAPVRGRTSVTAGHERRGPQAMPCRPSNGSTPIGRIGPPTLDQRSATSISAGFLLREHFYKTVAEALVYEFKTNQAAS